MRPKLQSGELPQEVIDLKEYGYVNEYWMFNDVDVFQNPMFRGGLLRHDSHLVMWAKEDQVTMPGSDMNLAVDIR